MVQDEDAQEDENDNDDRNTNEEPYNPNRIAIDTEAAHGKISGVPQENTVELPGVTPPENEVDDDFLPPLLPSDYDNDDGSDDKDEDTNTSTQQLRRVICPEFMPPTVRNVYNLRPRKKNDYVKDNIN